MVARSGLDVASLQLVGPCLLAELVGLVWLNLEFRRLQLPQLKDNRQYQAEEKH